jgi:octaheme c-type cytochrome (tetrathionate reductase family)
MKFDTGNFMKITSFLLSLLFLRAAVLAQDHTENVSGPFENPQEVTEECLMCHDEAGDEILESRHWNWLGSNISDTTTLVESRGKQNLINNFCIAVPSNYPRCTSCHISYGWKDENFDFNSPENIDCLVCHEQTGTYFKSPTGAGMPEATVDLLSVAQSVGKTTRRNCGTCHFDGGGGTGVKHGDMDNSLYNPTEEIDFHMGGMDFECTDCHETENHKIAGGSHGSMTTGENLISCEDCHDADPHEKELLNKHYTAVACETCHIPNYARTEFTKIWWDWSKAGEDREQEKDEFGNEIYSKKKGEFVWAKNVIPEYFWHNGTAEYYAIGEHFENTDLLKLNKLTGSISDSSSKISPFKVMSGKQPYDPENKYLIIPHLYGEDGYWKTFNWISASEIGMNEVDLNFSDSVDFIETEMYWPINHMVMTAANSLKCTSCHGKGGKNRLDWKALGYPDDPIKKGGREKNKLIKQ